ncbi:MAG: transcriptional repressor [Lachnospiraceae bacterium]|nr:transcriptional repressor [Lachnospiraceae bacterium]
MANVNDNETLSGFMGRDEIYERLKQNGLRITDQRKLIIDVITTEEYSCCKEVYLLAHKRDASIGIATVYRMINVLEDIGAISRKSIEKAPCNGRCCDMKEGCTVVADESTQVNLSEEDMQEALKYIMKKKGYEDVEQIKAVLFTPR